MARTCSGNPRSWISSVVTLTACRGPRPRPASAPGLGGAGQHPLGDQADAAAALGKGHELSLGGSQPRWVLPAQEPLTPTTRPLRRWRGLQVLAPQLVALDGGLQVRQQGEVQLARGPPGLGCKTTTCWRACGLEHGLLGPAQQAFSALSACTGQWAMPRDTDRSRPSLPGQQRCSTFVAQVGGHGADLVIAQQRHGPRKVPPPSRQWAATLEHHIQLAGRAPQQGVPRLQSPAPR